MSFEICPECGYKFNRKVTICPECDFTELKLDLTEEQLDMLLALERTDDWYVFDQMMKECDKETDMKEKNAEVKIK